MIALSATTFHHIFPTYFQKPKEPEPEPEPEPPAEELEKDEEDADSMASECGSSLLWSTVTGVEVIRKEGSQRKVSEEKKAAKKG